MSRPENQVLERLGGAGLSRVLDDVLDQPRLVRLANACGLKYPGMRTSSQSRHRILADLVARSAAEDGARKTIFRVLTKETRTAVRKWHALAADARDERLADEAFLLKNGNLGLHLYLLATNGANGLQPLLQLVGAREVSSNPSPASKRETTRLTKKVTELERKVRHLDTQLAKARDDTKQHKKDLIRRKGELAESRMLAERLRTDLEASQSAARRLEARATRKSSPDEGMGDVAKTLRKLTSEQRKLKHEIQRLAPSTKDESAEASPLIAEVRDAVGGLHKDLDALRRQRSKTATEQAKGLEELQGQVSSLKRALKRPPRRGRSRGAESRVGVFVDVQNVYYAARRLKGKLDFDALLQGAVAERRLIQATAYVVESKESDQSGFIAVLQQLGIEVRRKTLRVRADGSMKGDWDMELALDILDAAPNLDVVSLVSGDGDFTSLVKRVKRIGPRVEVMGFPRNTAKALLEAADAYQPLDRRFMIYPERKRSKAPRSTPSRTTAPDKPDGNANG